MDLDHLSFPDRTLDKVNRLLEVLEELGRHPALKDKLCMHGGTALNLFMLKAPRLSVDIDLSYIGSVDKERMLTERPAIESAVEEVIAFSGYTASGGNGDHAGRTFHLRYRGDWGSDQIKIDLIYLNRAPLIQPLPRPCYLRPALSVLTFSDFDLIGGKVKALYDRVAIRDLYDISNLRRYLNGYVSDHPDSTDLCHKIMLYYVSLSNHFPLPLSERVQERFAGRESDLTLQLYPMLRNSERPTLESLMSSAEAFINDYVLPIDNREKEYLERFAYADYQPELLFENYGFALAAARVSPEALWKLENLKKLANTTLR